MSSLWDQIDADASDVFLSDFAETVKRYARGEGGGGTDVTASFQEEDPERDIQSGRRNVRRGVLYVAKAQETDERDRWEVRSEMWDQVGSGRIEGGLKIVMLKRVEEETKKPTRP